MPSGSTLPVPDPPRSPEPDGGRRMRIRESDAALSVFLVVLLASTVMAGPLREAGAETAVVVLRVVALLAGVVAIAPHRAAAALAGVAALFAIGAQLVAGERGAGLLAARGVFFAVVCSALLARVFRRGRITVHRILGAVAVYVLLAVVWGNAYELLVVLRPDAIRSAAGAATPDDAMWLSFITITTTGYGDILPASAMARSLAALEAMVGVLYPAILVSRLVSLVQPPSARGE